MFEYIFSQINNISKTARETYGVNPVVLVVIYLGCTPVVYYSPLKTIRAVKKKLGNQIILWSTIFLCTTFAPLGYVLLYGKNIPWWVYGIIMLLIAQAVLFRVLKPREKPENNINMENTKFEQMEKPSNPRLHPPARKAQAAGAGSRREFPPRRGEGGTHNGIDDTGTWTFQYS
jgi:hypothetical protein